MQKVLNIKKRFLHLTFKKTLILSIFEKVINFFQFLLENFNSKINILQNLKKKKKCLV